MDAVFRRLLWKEWRESRWLFLVPIVVSAVWGALVFFYPCDAAFDRFFGPAFGKIAVSFYPCAVALILYLQVFLFCLLGARAFASESFSGTGRFLFALPVRPGELIWAKAFLPLVALIVALVLSGIGAVPLFGVHLPCDHEAVLPVVGGMWLLGHAAGFAAFSLCLFLGILLEHPVATVALGLTISVAEISRLGDIVGIAGTSVDLSSPVGIGFEVILMLIQGGVFLGLSVWYLSPERSR